LADLSDDFSRWLRRFRGPWAKELMRTRIVRHNHFLGREVELLLALLDFLDDVGLLEVSRLALQVVPGDVVAQT